MDPDVHEQGVAPPPLSDEEAEFRANFAELVDYYRVSQVRKLVAAFLPGSLVLLPLGCLITALSVSRQLVPPALSPYVAVLGLCVTASGPLWCIVSLLRAIRRDDLYVAIRTGGLALRLDPEAPPELLPWDAIADVRFDAARKVLLVEVGERTIEIRQRFAELGLDELGRKLRDARRLAVWRRLTPRYAVR
jgi:hypothetical protein